MPITVLSPQAGSAIAEEGLELLAAFSQVADPVVRRAVIAMVRGLRPARRSRRRDEGDFVVSVRGRARRHASL